jgi:DNA-directed RNA polymerase subunit RPC12/RpoP
MLLASCHSAAGETAIDRELRCTQCANRMFSSDAGERLARGLRCSRCLGALVLVPADVNRGDA